MRIVVCVRPSPDGEIGPFDAAAYECALRMPGAEVILLAMAPPSGREVLERLTRLGARDAYLLCDPAFAGADTLATTYTLSLALARLAPQLVFCGRQTMQGDTGQVGPGLAVRGGYALVTQVMELPEAGEREVVCRTRGGAEKRVPYPALLTFERICPLRFPGLFSRPGRVTVWNAADLAADVSRCGTSGSPTRVIATHRNENDRRRCRFIAPEEFDAVFAECLQKDRHPTLRAVGAKTKEKILIVGDAPREMADTVGENIVRMEPDTPRRMAERIRAEAPLAVLWDSTPRAKETAAAVAVLLGVGLCADCTRMEVVKTGVETAKEGKKAGEMGTETAGAGEKAAGAGVETVRAGVEAVGAGVETDEARVEAVGAREKTAETGLVLYRPAFAGDLIAAITARTCPVMATVRTVNDPGSDAVFALGLGAKEYLAPIGALAREKGGDLAATRAMVDAGLMPYDAQVGLTGKSVNPKVYVALGVSGAVHHIAGMKNALSVIAVNRDRNAPIFEYADFGIVADLSDFLGRRHPKV